MVDQVLKGGIGNDNLIDFGKSEPIPGLDTYRGSESCMPKPFQCQ